MATHFLGNTAGQRYRGYTARLRYGDAFLAPGLGKQELGDLGRFAGTRFTGENEDVVLAEGVANGGCVGPYGE
jgi:hypothetical protein